MSKEKPIWRDGEPENLAAAANDALEWLRLFQNYLSQHITSEKSEWDQAKITLGGAIRNLLAYLPSGEPLYLETHTKTGVVFEVVISSQKKIATK